MMASDLMHAEEYPNRIFRWKGENINSIVKRPFLERTFRLAERGTTMRTQLVAGATTFLPCASVWPLNPIILSAAGMDATALFWATTIASCIGCR